MRGQTRPTSFSFGWSFGPGAEDIEKQTAFDIGYKSGYEAGLSGDPLMPTPPPFRLPEQPDFAVDFAKGAALGYARGVERFEEIIAKAEWDLGRNRD